MQFSYSAGTADWMKSAGPVSWEEILPVPIKPKPKEVDLPPIARTRTRRRRQPELRALRWREARWIHRILRKQGRFAQLGLDRLVIKHEVGRTRFVGQFANYLGVDPFVSNPHLLGLFTGFDLDCDGRVDPREMSCCFRVLSRPDTSPHTTLNDFFLFFSFMADDGELHIQRSHVMNLLLTAAVSDEEATTIYNLAQKFLLLIGAHSRKRAPSISRGLFVASINKCPKLVEEIRLQFLRRLSDNERLRVLKAATEHSMDIVESHEYKIRLQKAAKWVFSFLLPRQKGRFFYLWVEHARFLKARRLAMAKAERHWREHKGRKWMQYWAKWAKRPKIYRAADLMGGKVLKARVFHRLKRHYHALTKLRNMRKRKLQYHFERKCKKAVILQAKVRKRWEDEWKVLIFVAIRDEAMDGMRVRKAARLCRRVTKRIFYAQWKSYWKTRMKRRAVRNKDKLEKKAAEEEAKRKAEEEAKRRAEAEAKAAEVAAAKEARWKAQVAKTREVYKRKEIVNWQRERRAERKAKEARARERRMQGLYAQIRQKIEDKVRDDATKFFKSKDGQVLVKLEKYPEMVAAVGEREDLTAAAKKEQEGKDWQLVYDWHSVCRQYKNVKTGDIVWPRHEKAQPAKARMNLANATRIVKDEYIREKLLVVQKRIERKCDELRISEHREWNVRLIQKAYKSFKMMRALRKGMRDMVIKARAKNLKRNRKKQQAAAFKLQDWLKRRTAKGRAQHLLANLVLSMWVCRTHPETGRTMWVNLRTHKIQFHEPALMKSALTGGAAKLPDPEWTFEVGAGNIPVYTDTKTGETQNKPPFGYHMCVECSRNFADRHCQKCDDRYCHDCYMLRHSKGNRAKHTWKPVSVTRIVCHWCKKTPAEVMCEDCGDTNYCEPCALHVHSLDEYSGHEITPM